MNKLIKEKQVDIRCIGMPCISLYSPSDSNGYK